MAEREVQFVTVAGVDIPAALVVCPSCHVLDLGTHFDTSVYPWIACCGNGHEWTIAYKADA